MSGTTFPLPQRPPVRLLDQDLKLDPVIKQMQADIESQLMARRNPLDWLPPWQRFLPPAPSPNTPLDPFKVPAPPPLPSLWKFEPGAGPQTARAGTVGDVLNAILQLPVSQALMKQAAHEAARQARELRKVWDRSSIGGRSAIVTVGTVLAGASVAGIIGDQEARRFVFDTIKGHAIPIPLPATQAATLKITDYGANVAATVPLGVKGLQLSATGDVIRTGKTSFSLGTYSLSLSLDVLKFLAK
ncbi:MAG TPA: hypothetical protein VJR58_15395 [Vineibacter sp.]|nr:hypothetical protein [Vineibacter sp.]